MISEDLSWDGRGYEKASRGRNPDQLSTSGPTPRSEEAGRSCGSADGRQYGTTHAGRGEEEPGEAGR